MKGFWIEIVNNLLEPKHRKAMKESVWLFMWLLDKITSISEDQIGTVLGGKPISYEEVNKDLDVPERTYRDWVARLKKYNYILTKRASNGLIFQVNKAKKRFGQKASDVQKTAYLKNNSDVQKTQVGCAEKVGSDVQKTQVAYMKDNTVDNTRQDKLGLDKPTSRKEITFNNDDYKKVIASYEELKGIKPQGQEYLPIQQAVKSMFMSGRSAEDIIACMVWFKDKAASGDKKYVWTENWTIQTIKMKIAEFLAGKLGDKESIPPEYAKFWN